MCSEDGMDCFSIVVCAIAPILLVFGIIFFFTATVGTIMTNRGYNSTQSCVVAQHRVELYACKRSLCYLAFVSFNITEVDVFGFEKRVLFTNRYYSESDAYKDLNLHYPLGGEKRCFYGSAGIALKLQNPWTNEMAIASYVLLLIPIHLLLILLYGKIIIYLRKKRPS